jgi:hypothetical protein
MFASIVSSQALIKLCPNCLSVAFILVRKDKNIHIPANFMAIFHEFVHYHPPHPVPFYGISDLSGTDHG